jgi:hypothetical protein
MRALDAIEALPPSLPLTPRRRDRAAPAAAGRQRVGDPAQSRFTCDPAGTDAVMSDSNKSSGGANPAD